MKRFGWILAVGALSLIWTISHLFFSKFDPVTQAFLTGGSIIAAAFLLSWASEAAEMDFSGSLVLAVLAIIVMLPEYAVDMVLTWKAGQDISFAPYAMANMSGANRLLSGMGIVMVVIAYFFHTGKKEVELASAQRLDCAILFIVIFYSFLIVLKGYLTWWDTAIFFAVFLFYLWRVAKLPSHPAQPIGPARAIAELSSGKRKLAWLSMMGLAAFVIFQSAEPFTHSLLEIGESFHWDKFMLVQVIAPLASESPEFVIAYLFVRNLRPQRGLGMLVSTLANQWTLLVGMIPLIFMVSVASTGSPQAGSVAQFPIDQRQAVELALAAAQALFVVTLLGNVSLSVKEALVIAVLFIAQFFFPSVEARTAFVFLFLIASAVVALKTGGSSWKAMFASLRN